MKALVITGAAGGIGRALVEEFSAAGYRVLALDRLAPSEVDSEWHYLECDLHRLVLDPRYATDVLEQLRALLQGANLKALINNAAVQVVRPIEQLSREDWAETLAVNMLAPFILVKRLLPELEASRGYVLNISSIHAKQTKPYFVAYATSKAALSGLTRAMAVELGGRIRVNAIEPAAIDTGMLKAGFAGKEGLLPLLEKCHPTGSIGTPAELAGLALSIVEGAAQFMNGACISLDGGISAALTEPTGT